MRALSRGVAGLAVFGLVALVCLGLAEVFLRSFAPIHLSGNQDAFRYDEEAGVLLRPGIHMLHTTDHLQEMRVNRLGTVNWQESFEEYPLALFTLGDSFTQGTGLPADSSYPFQLDMALNRGDEGVYRPRIAVINLGLAAFGGEQSRIVYDRFRGELGEPDGVLYLGYENDWRDDLLFLDGYTHRYIVHGSPTYGALAPLLIRLSRLQLVTRAKLALSSIRSAAILGHSAEGTARAGKGEQAAEGESSVAELEWPVIESIVKEARDAGSFVVLGWAEGDSRSYRWLAQRAAERGIAFADWYPKVQSVQELLPELSMKNPHSGGHWRPWVNRIIADEFARHVEAALADEPQPRPGVASSAGATPLP
jgi:hypothetical protein